MLLKEPDNGLHDKINYIGFAKIRPVNEKNNIQVMPGQLRRFIKYFQGAVNILAINYMQYKMERRKEGEDAFTMEAAIRSVLSFFRLRPDSIDYLMTLEAFTKHVMFTLDTYKGYTYWPILQNDTPITVTLWEGV